MTKNIKFFVILILIAILVIITVFYNRIKKKEMPNVSYVGVEDFYNIGVEQKVLQTPAYRKLLNGEYSFLYADLSKATCAVAIESLKYVKENNKYVWLIKANKLNKDISFEVSSAYKQLCLNNNNCICNKDILKSSGICSFNPTEIESRVYIQPYFVNLINQKNCSFNIDKVPAEIKNQNNQTTYYIDIPKNQENAEVYKIEIPINSASYSTGCLQASLDIVKVNTVSSELCSAEGPEQNFILDSNNRNTPEQKVEIKKTKDFYSVEALKKSVKDYQINCYHEEDLNINNVGIEVHKGEKILDNLKCDSSKCTKQQVIDNASNRKFTKYSIPYSFSDNGVYKISCVNYR